MCGRPLICHVAARGSSNQLDFIIRAGADVNPGGDVNTGADVNPGTDINTVLENDTPLNLAVNNKRCKEHKCVRILLKAGARINVRTRRYPNALTRYLYQWWPALSCQLAFNEKIGAYHGDFCLLLFAAGETVSTETIDAVDKLEQHRPFLDFLLQRENGLDSKHICRRVIRERLLELDPGTNLAE